MKGLRPLFQVVLTTLLSASFVACSDDDPTIPPEPSKEPSVTVTAGTPAETSLSFTITPENAEQCAYICIELEEGLQIPTAEDILATSGTQVSATESTTVEVAGLTPETEYVIVAAASDGETAVLSRQISMTTLEKGAIVFLGASAEVYTGNATVTFTEESDTYQLSLDFYYDSEARYLPEGTYNITDASSAGTVGNNVSYTNLWLKKESDTPMAITSGTVTVVIDENDAYDIMAEFTTGQGDFKAVYKGEIEGIQLYYGFMATEAKRMEPNDEIPGEYYLKLNDANWSFELTLDIFADPESTTLPEGTYTVGADKTPGTIGPASSIDIYSPYSQNRFAEGTVTVTKEGDVYTLDMNFADENGYEMKGSFTGKIANMERAPKITEITMESAEANIYNSQNATLKFSKGNDRLELDIYYAEGSKFMPAGTYTVGGSSAGMIATDPTYTYFFYNDTKYSLTSGTVEVAIVDGEYDVVAEFPTDAGNFKLTYKGAIDGYSLFYGFTATEAKRQALNDEVPGQYRLKLNDANWSFELTLDIFADPGSTTLPEGTYTVGADKTPGTIGPASSIDIYSPYSQNRFAEGTVTVTVTKDGDVYTLDIDLADADGYWFKGKYTGRISDM